MASCEQVVQHSIPIDEARFWLLILCYSGRGTAAAGVPEDNVVILGCCGKNFVETMAPSQAIYWFVMGKRLGLLIRFFEVPNVNVVAYYRRQHFGVAWMALNSFHFLVTAFWKASKNTNLLFSYSFFLFIENVRDWQEKDLAMCTHDQDLLVTHNLDWLDTLFDVMFYVEGVAKCSVRLFELSRLSCKISYILLHYLFKW